MRKTGMKTAAFVCLLLAGSLISPTSAMGKVWSTEEPAGEAGMVFVAGNPDLYPLEYYDTKEKCYKGVMPALLEEISDELGTDFVYVSSGTSDKRESLSKNRQAEVVSGYIIGENQPDNAISGCPLFPITVDGETYDVGFAYTELASEELRDKMEGYLSGKGARELMNLLVSETREGRSSGMSMGVKLVLVFEVLLFIGTACMLRRRRKKQEEKAEVNRMVDTVTGFGNKEYFRHWFSSYISDHTRLLYYLVYLCFDINRVNSYYGEAEAESILCHAADVLSGHVGDSDFFARVTDGGFAIACQKASKEQMEEWTELILKKINEYSDRFKQDYRPKFCAGVYKLKRDDVSFETALYAAQQGYREAVRTRQSYIISNEKILSMELEKQELCKECIRALEEHQFHSYLQFITDAKTGRIIGAEALSRWKHPQKGLLMPRKYIDAMEENETIVKLDYYMFEEVCRLLQRFREEGREDLILFCNFSRKTVSLADFVDKVCSISQRYQFDHQHLCMEITENSMFDNDKISISNLQRCKDLGFIIAMDDVGSGYSSFRDLSQYPMDLVKIDRDLLLAASHEKGQLLLQGMNALFHSIHLRTLCEGIETQDQCDMVREMGIDYMQGFYIQRALPVKEAIRWLIEKEDG